ncbi:scaffold protein [Microviridae sp.]|nr:scaffold protein [Microviridae sp.]
MSKKVFLRTAYNYDTDEASLLSGLVCSEPTKAQQQFKDECDINTIVRRFGVTGLVPGTTKVPTYGDFTGVSDYHQAMNVVAQANTAFHELPAHIRLRFANDPGRLIDFLEDDDNRKEAESLGLLNRKVDASLKLDAVSSSEPPQVEGGN